MSMFERLAGTPCAGCIHMCWDLFYDQPCGICTLKLRNKYGAWKPASKKCEKLGFEYYDPEEWKVERTKAYAKKNGCISPETAVQLARAISNV